MDARTGGFAGARRQEVPLSGRELVAPIEGEGGLPLVVAPHTDVDLASWLRQHQDVLAGWLDDRGAVLFRGFDIDLPGFAAVAEALVGPAVAYRERSSPRTELAPGIYTSTDYPADQVIPLHNESSYQQTFPARLAFLCVVPAQRGGQTPLADCRRVLARLDPAAVETFQRRRIRYVRNYSQVLGMSWQEAFQTTDPQAVDEYCHEREVTTRWGADGTLRTEQVRPPVVVHPRTGQPVWFNHAAFFHISSHPAPVRDSLLAQVGESGLPVNSYFGDGGQIDDQTMAGIRTAYETETVARPWQRGDVLVLDNLLVAHGRASFAGPRRVAVSMGGALRHADLLPPGSRS